jgi:hypothetical protein
MFTPDKVDVSEEIRRFIAQAVKDGSSVQAGKSALRIAQAYPNCRLTAAQIAERIMAAALAAHLPMTLSKPKFSTAAPQDSCEQKLW